MCGHISEVSILSEEQEKEVLLLRFVYVASKADGSLPTRSFQERVFEL